MRKISRLIFVCSLLLSFVLVNSLAAQTVSKTRPPLSAEFAPEADTPVSWLPQFVPDWRPFWDNSKNWTTNYGPAYRDTVVQYSQMLACTGQFALCFHSGPEPYPCHMSPDGRSADCKCMVLNSKNYTLMTAILNYPVYADTLALCGPDGSLCAGDNQAPVCKYIQNANLIPGAEVLSTYDPDSRQSIIDAVTKGTPITRCSKAPYAGCMTAPCQLNGDGTANCKCPVFYGNFQLTGEGASCSLGGDLIPSASYSPALDRTSKN